MNDKEYTLGDFNPITHYLNTQYSETSKEKSSSSNQSNIRQIGLQIKKASEGLNNQEKINLLKLSENPKKNNSLNQTRLNFYLTDDKTLKDQTKSSNFQNIYVYRQFDKLIERQLDKMAVKKAQKKVTPQTSHQIERSSVDWHKMSSCYQTNYVTFAKNTQFENKTLNPFSKHPNTNQRSRYIPIITEEDDEVEQIVKLKSSLGRRGNNDNNALQKYINAFNEIREKTTETTQNTHHNNDISLSIDVDSTYQGKHSEYGPSKDQPHEILPGSNGYLIKLIA